MEVGEEGLKSPGNASAPWSPALQLAAGWHVLCIQHTMRRSSCNATSPVWTTMAVATADGSSVSGLPPPQLHSDTPQPTTLPSAIPSPASMPQGPLAHLRRGKHHPRMNSEWT